MRKTIAILGTLLIAAVLIISGSAVAAWYYIDHVETELYATNSGNIVGGPDSSFATCGQNGRPNKLGYIVGDLGSGNEMGPLQDFTVFANMTNGINETYDVLVSEHPNLVDFVYVGSGWDSENLVFTTPGTDPSSWRYIWINGTSGYTHPTFDPIHGPEIDAVGWET
jgi:hypothetical protein